MTSLYHTNSMIDKLWKEFSAIFTDATKPTARHLFEMIVSVFGLNGFQSVKYNFEHFINEISQYELKSFYYTLNESKINLQDWMKRLVEAALSIRLFDTRQPILLAIDDTRIEKFGEKFEHWSKLFDHAAHNGSNYLNGHCFVSLLLSIPVKDSLGCRYLSFPVAYRMWTKEQTKLEMAADLVRSAMTCLGSQRRVILCCDSWYPKGCVKQLVEEYANLTIICNVRSDTALYALRWNIEIAYYEQKTFWALGDYRLRSQTGIERLLNLLTLCYASTKILPFLSDDFLFLKGLSPQQARFALSKAINRELFFASFSARLETAKISPKLISTLKSIFFSLHPAA